MACHKKPIDCQRLLEALRLERVFYEIFSELTWYPSDSFLLWFEIALHAEADGYQPPNHPRSREVFSLLMELAEFLIQQMQSHAPYKVDLSASYYTLHPPACGDFRRTRLCRSLSLVFVNVTPYRKGEEPALLTEIMNHLSLLGIARLKADRFTEAGDN